MSRKARTGVVQDAGAPTLRQMAATIEELLVELQRVAERDLQTRGAGPAERARVAEELKALRVEQEALLTRLQRLEQVAAQPEPSGP